MTKIKNPKLFEAVYNAVRQKIVDRQFPQTYLPAGAHFERASDKKYVSLSPNGLITKGSAEAAITIRDADSDWNRFTGTSPIPTAQKQGGLYVFKHEEAGIAELMHYTESMNTIPVNIATKRISVPHLMATKAIFRIRTKKPMLIANLSIFSGGSAVNAFMNAIENIPAVKSQLGGLSFIKKVLDPNDYSASRAMGLAFGAERSVNGIDWETARDSDRVNLTGNNICLFGENMQKVPNLEVESATLSFLPNVLYDDKGNRIKLNDNDETIINKYSPNATNSEYSILIEVDTGFKMGMRVVK